MSETAAREEREYDAEKGAWIIRTLNADGTISHRVEPGPAPRPRRRKAKKEGPPRPRELTDLHVEALCEFRPDKATYYPDNKLAGFSIYIGPRSATWVYRVRRSVKGSRRMVFEKLGEWPRIGAEEARKRCAIAMGLTAQAIDNPALRDPVTFGAAFSDYLTYLKAKAEKKGKPARWHYNVTKLGDSIILPRWAQWTLADMAMQPAAAAEWHKKVSKDHGPVSANHCARVVRATYKRAMRLDRSLPVYLPTSAVEFNEERASQKALPFKSFPAWLKAWRKIDKAIRQAYHLTGLLSGTRPGELARSRWSAYSDNERTLTIADAKAGNNITIPVTDEIAAALKMAREAAEAIGLPTDAEALIFPGCKQVAWRDDLPARGNMLRHTYRTVAADLKVDELITHFLMGHAPEGISQKYIATLILANSPNMRKEQGRMSRRIVELLGLNARTLKSEIAAGLAQSAEAAQAHEARAKKAFARAQQISARKRRGRVLGPRRKPAPATA